MAYVPGVKFDLFVSYAHADNRIPGGGERHGWVDCLVAELEDQLRKRLGEPVAISFDRDRASNDPLTPQLLGAAREAALLLVVLSPSYLNSEWCERERSAFLGVAGDRIAEGRVFLVRSLDVPPGEVPDELGDLVGLPFFVHDPDIGAVRTLGERDRDEKGFLKQIYKLSAEVASKLCALGKDGGAGASPRGAGARVFVARATDDLEEREEQLRCHLTQAGVEVQPRRLYAQADAEGFEAALGRELEPARLFVQILSAVRGPETPFGGERRLPRLQYEVARKLGKPVLLWRDRALAPGAVTDPLQRALLEEAIACPFEEFKRRVAEEAQREPEGSSPPPPVGSVFVDRELSDRELADSVRRALEARGITCFLPLESGTPAQIRRDLEGNLRDCDGVLVVYGQSDPAWVREQVRYGVKVFTRRERRPALGIYQGPPPPKGELNLFDPSMLLLDASQGFSSESLEPFLARLRA